MDKQIIKIPDDFGEIEKVISIMLDKNEDAIRYYISRYIYTSIISFEINQEINNIFKKIRDNL
jgi:hypothetical protein